MNEKRYSGLTDAQVIESRRIYGPNLLTPRAESPWWREFLKKFSDPLIIILLTAGALSVGISFYEYFGLGQEWKVFFEPIGIFVAVLLATGLAFIFEHKANREFKILNLVNDDEPVEVVRNGSVTTIPRKEVVVGDIVLINTGEEVPADGELIEAVALSVDESSLTGEPVSYKGLERELPDNDSTYPSNRLFRGTKVMEGHGAMQVLKVGDATEMGRVYEEVQIDDSVKTPLNEQLDKLSELITKASYLIAGLIVAEQLIQFLTGEWVSWVMLLSQTLKTIMVAVTLIVVAVPEGLPMAITLSMAYSMNRMLKTNNLVRRMHACETMGATTVICTDKTGTLTENRMQVCNADLYGEALKDILYEGIAVNSTAQVDMSGGRPAVIGNPTEGALLLWLADRGIRYQDLRLAADRIDELPFTTERKYMATLVRSAVTGGRILYLKGAPEIVFGLCSDSAGVVKEDLEKRLRGYQNQAMRTLGLAYAEVSEEFVMADLASAGFTFLGVMAISDPVREDVPEAVEVVRKAGIEIKIVTGDTPGTAKEIGRRIGLWDDTRDSERNIISGVEFAGLSDEELRERVSELKIIARARPMDKKRLVEALRANNEVVAVTGDGTNDAPALKAAHVGLSMGAGTSVAKEASDITIIDNSFSSIGRAVMWGRSLYKNIQRFLLFQLTVNVAACLLVLAGSFVGKESPLTVTQMLWVNLIMDTFGAMALASLPPSQRVMKEMPRDRRASILSRSMLWEICGVGFIFFAITLGLYWVFNHAEIESLPQIIGVTLGEASPVTGYEATLIFSIFVWTHFWYMFNARGFDTRESIFRLPMSSGFVTIVAIIIVGQLFITEVAYEFFNVEPMLHTVDWRFNPEGALDLLIIVVGSSAVLWVREAWRKVKAG